MSNTIHTEPLPETARAARTTTRRFRIVRLAAVFLVLVAICLGITFDRGRATSFDFAGVRADAPISEVLPKLSESDSSTYLRIGHAIAESRGFPSRFRNDLNWWPPGMFLSNAALFTVFGSDMPVGLVIGATMALLWAMLLTVYVDLLLRYLHWAAVALMIGIVMVSDVMRGWFLGLGLFWSEGLYTLCILAALYAALRAAAAQSDARRVAWAGTVGVLLGLSAYVRAVSDFLGWLMIAVLGVWGVLTVVRMAVDRRPRDPKQPPRPACVTWRKHLVALVVCAAAFQVVTVPWRLYAGQNLRPGNYGWSTAPNATWDDSWKPDQLYLARGQEWLLEGRPNTACKVDRSTCERIARYELGQFQPYSGFGRYSETVYRGLTVRAIVHHPVAYGLDRLSYLRRAWFWKPSDRSSELVQNGLATAMVIAALWLSVRRVRQSGPDLLALIFPGLLLATMAPFLTLHYEARYFATLKLSAVVAVFALVALDSGATRVLHVGRGARDSADEAATASIRAPGSPGGELLT